MPIPAGQRMANPVRETHILISAGKKLRLCITVLSKITNSLRASLKENGFEFTSETDTEVIVHKIAEQLQSADKLLNAVKNTIPSLEGAYALGVVYSEQPDTLIACRKGSPLVIGIGIGEYFIASDIAALLPVTQRFIFLEEGDIAEIKIDSVVIYDENDRKVERPDHSKPVKSGCSGQGKISPLHAQGNLRAALGGFRNIGRTFYR